MEQNFKMLSQIEGPPLKSPLRPFNVLVFCLLLTHSCRASDAVFSPVIRLLGIDRTKGGVTLNCESKGWPLKPDVLWLDIDGKVLSSGPTETVRGPDDLYTVSSTVTFGKRHINSFNCKVQQMNISETRETEIYIADDFFEAQSKSAPTVGLAVCLAVCILIILLLVFFVWRLNISKTKKTHRDETDNNCPKSNKESEPLRRDETVEIKEKGEKKSKQHLKKQQQQEEQLREQQRREGAENEVKTLTDQLEAKKNEVENKQAELQQLHEEKQRNEEELQNKLKEVEIIADKIAQCNKSFWGRNKEEDQLKKDKEKAEIEVETLKKTLETQDKKVDTKIKEFEAQVQQLQNEIQGLETNLQTLMEEQQSNNMETESNQAAPVQVSSSSVSGHVQFKWPMISRQKFQDEQQRREEAEKRVQILEKELQTMSRELEEERTKRENAKKEVEALKKSSRPSGTQANLETSQEPVVSGAGYSLFHR